MKKSLLALALVPMLFASAAQAQSAAYAIDPTHTFVTFEIDHFGTSTNRGRFDKKEGTIQFDRAGKTGKVDITIDTTSINTGTAPFDGHLKSAEILNVAATRPRASSATSSCSMATRSRKSPASSR